MLKGNGGGKIVVEDRILAAGFVQLAILIRQGLSTA
jgi:hypothetical protein